MTGPDILARIGVFAAGIGVLTMMSVSMLLWTGGRNG